MPNYHIYQYQGEQYHCGCLPQQLPGRLRGYQATRPVYSLDQITTAIANAQGSLFAWVWVILNQGRYGDCWDYSALNALMTKIYMLYGEKVLLDASIAVVLTGQYDGGANAIAPFPRFKASPVSPRRRLWAPTPRERSPSAAKRLGLPVGNRTRRNGLCPPESGRKPLRPLNWPAALSTATLESWVCRGRAVAMP